MPKKKGTPGGNPNPVQTPEFVAKKFAPAPDLPPGVELGQPMGVALPIEIDAAVRGLDKRSVWLRRVITEAAKVELLGERPAPGAESPAVNPGAEPAPAGDSGEPSPAGMHINTVEVRAAVDELLAIPRLPKLAKENLLKLRERLIR